MIDRLKKSLYIRAIRATLDENVLMIHRFLDGGIELRTLVKELQNHKRKIDQKTTKEFAEAWQACWGNLKIGDAELSYGQLPREEVMQFVQGESRKLLELIHQYLD